MPYDLLSADIPFVIGDTQTSKRGQKFAPLTVNGALPLYQVTDFDHALYAPFGCGVYQERGDETRLNLDLQLTEGSELLEILDGYDRYFEGKLKATPKSTYHPLVSRDDGGSYPPKFRVKVNTHQRVASCEILEHGAEDDRSCTRYHDTRHTHCSCGLFHQSLVHERTARRDS